MLRSRSFRLRAQLRAGPEARGRVKLALDEVLALAEVLVLAEVLAEVPAGVYTLFDPNDARQGRHPRAPRQGAAAAATSHSRGRSCGRLWPCEEGQSVAGSVHGPGSGWERRARPRIAPPTCTGASSPATAWPSQRGAWGVLTRPGERLTNRTHGRTYVLSSNALL